MSDSRDEKLPCADESERGRLVFVDLGDTDKMEEEERGTGAGVHGGQLRAQASGRAHVGPCCCLVDVLCCCPRRAIIPWYLCHSSLFLGY
jgi:hypothetical protein